MKKILIIFVTAGFLCSGVYAQQVSNNIQMLLSNEGRIMYGEEPNSLVVMDYPENLNRIQEYLALMDVAPAQVLIEAKIVEVQLNKEHSLGINWQAFAAKGGLEIGKFTVSSRLDSDGIPQRGPIAQQIPWRSPSYPPGSNSVEDPFTVTIFDDNLNVVLNALATDLETNIISAPSVTTVNNRQAQIRVIESLPWAEPELERSEFGVTVTWSINFEAVGITLQVTPTINEDGRITMQLLPEISEKVSDYPLTVVSGGTSIDYTVPVIDRRSASTKVVVGSGQTLIIGGLIKNKTIKGNTKVPLLGDVPVLGRLFKSSKDTVDKTELLIFVSPRIINENEIVRMARQDRFGPGRHMHQERLRQEKMALIMERSEREKKEKLALSWKALSKKNEELSAQTMKLQEMLLTEEKSLQSLEEAKQAVIQRKQALTR